MQPTLTLHCHKLVRNINEHVYTQKILQSRGLSITAILHLSLWGQQSLLIPQASKIKMVSSVEKKTIFKLNGQNNQ